jgi:ABC-type branched-subunit amino acid transport system ATPase component
MVAAWNADITRDGVDYPGSSGTAEERVEALLELTSLTEHADDPAHGLDQQSQKRLVVAGALALTPQVLLLDEPFAGLTHEEAVDLVDVLNLLQHAGVTILLIDHNIRAVMNFCDRVYVLDYGKVLMEGTPAEVQNDERVAQVYLRGDA